MNITATELENITARYAAGSFDNSQDESMSELDSLYSALESEKNPALRKELLARIEELETAYAGF